MTLIALVGFVALVASVSGQQPRYVDYDLQDIGAARQAAAAAPAPVRPAYNTRAIQQQPRYTAQSLQPRPTPVPILKQINRHNDDGSYTYGYEGADGSFKIETKLPTGEVMGKYGYVDDTGKLRVIDYGANRYGFQPVGEGITVAPPTLVDETTAKDRQGSFADYDDESAYRVPSRAQRPQKRPEIFVQRAQPTPARAYPAFEEVRPTPSYEEAPVRFVPTPAPARFAPPARRPSPVRFTPPVQQQVPQYVQPQQVQQYVQQQQIPQHIPQQVPQQVPQHIAHIPQQVQPSPVPQRAAVPNAIPLAQSYAAPPTPPSRPAPVRENTSSGIFLDQLLKQYSLPAGVGGQPLHDITFGSYSSQTNY